MKPCPYCATAIPAVSVLCPYCGQDLPTNWAAGGITNLVLVISGAFLLGAALAVAIWGSASP
jgi:hypothetical protein